MRTIALVFLIAISACSGSPAGVPPERTPSPATADIGDFESCVEAGGPILRTQPPRCVGPDGKVYVAGQ